MNTDKWMGGWMAKRICLGVEVSPRTNVSGMEGIPLASGGGHLEPVIGNSHTATAFQRRQLRMGKAR